MRFIPSPLTDQDTSTLEQKIASANQNAAQGRVREGWFELQFNHRDACVREQAGDRSAPQLVEASFQAIKAYKRTW